MREGSPSRFSLESCMGRPPKASTMQDDAPIASPKMVLKKNHGLVIAGKANEFYPAGTELDPATDGELIAKLVQSGAIFE